MVKLREEQKAELIKKERERRRIARLRQVRQQASEQAKIIRKVVSQKKNEIIEDIRSELHEEIQAHVDELAEIENLKNEKAKSARKSMTPRTKKKLSRRREMTENDLKIAQQRNVEAMRRLQEAKKLEKLEKEQKLAKRRLAEQRANEILRGGNGI